MFGAATLDSRQRPQLAAHASEDVPARLGKDVRPRRLSAPPARPMTREAHALETSRRDRLGHSLDDLAVVVSVRTRDLVRLRRHLDIHRRRLLLRQRDVDDRLGGTLTTMFGCSTLINGWCPCRRALKSHSPPLSSSNCRTCRTLLFLSPYREAMQHERCRSRERLAFFVVSTTRRVFRGQLDVPCHSDHAADSPGET